MTNELDILIVDDDDRLRSAATKLLTSEGYAVEGVASAAEALGLLKQSNAALALCDLRLMGSDGISLLQKIRELRPETEVVMITGHASVEKAVQAMRLGAYDFIEKPVESEQLLKIVAKALEKQQLTSENRQLRRQLEQQKGLDSLIGNGPAILSVKQRVRQIAPTDVNVLIQGESGTGKEVVADSLHYLSGRRPKPFLKISCAAIPETLLESELFGYERGAFTGANTARSGKFELADGGTLMLDEIAEMSPQLQAKLLRVLQDGKFQRLGGTKDICVDVRLICATHANIPEAITQNKFRHDLYYRINTVQIALPPLRERRDDIPLLASHFLSFYSTQMKKNIHAISPVAMEKLQTHSWPGNVRELEHVIQGAVALTQGKTIADFTFAPQASHPPVTTAGAQNGACLSIPLGTTLDEVTRKLVEATIEQCAGNKLKAAKILGIAPRTMYRHFPKMQD